MKAILSAANAAEEAKAKAKESAVAFTTFFIFYVPLMNKKLGITFRPQIISGQRFI